MFHISGPLVRCPGQDAIKIRTTVKVILTFYVVCTGLEPGLAALRLLGQVRNSRYSALERRNLSFAHHASVSLHLPLAALNSAPHDVNKFTSWDTGERLGHEHSEKPTR